MRRRQIIKGIPQRHPQIQKRPNKSKLRTATDGRSKNASEASKPAAAPLPSPDEDDEGSALQSVLFSRLISALSRDVFNFWYYTHGKVKRELSSDKNKRTCLDEKNYVDPSIPKDKINRFPL